MAGKADLTDSSNRDRVARAAGFGRSSDLTLSKLERRRAQLWTISLFVVASLAVLIAVVSLASEDLPSWLRVGRLSGWVVIVLVAALALAFIVYIVEKESSLRKLTALLIEEQARSIALKRRLDEIAALLEVNKALNATLNTPEVFTLILSLALDRLGGGKGALLRMDDVTGSLRLVSRQGRGDTPREVGLESGLAAKVGREREPVLVVPDDLPSVDPLLDGIHSGMVAPLIRRDELLGVLMLGQTDPEHEYTEDDLAVLQLFAGQAAIAIGNASQFERERDTIVRLEELTRMKSDFVATVTHELKTPLTAIIGAAKTLARNPDAMTPEVHASLMDMIERQGSRLLRLVEDVLTASRIESGSPRLRREVVELRPVVERVVEDLVHTWAPRREDLSVTTDPGSPSVWGDPDAIGQVISNLVENALKYSTEGEKITVSVRETPTQASITVVDEGQGIAEEQVLTVFERFQRADVYEANTISGFGLGLYIIKSLVEAHRGDVEVASELGKGTTFTVHLPKRAE